MPPRRSAAYSVRDKSPGAMTRLAWAYCQWREQELDGSMMAEMAEVLQALGVRRTNGARRPANDQF